MTIPSTALITQCCTSVLTVLYSNKPPCLIFHRAVLASIDVATGYASFSRLAYENLSCTKHRGNYIRLS